MMWKKPGNWNRKAGLWEWKRMRTWNSFLLNSAAFTGVKTLTNPAALLSHIHQVPSPAEKRRLSCMIQGPIGHSLRPKSPKIKPESRHGDRVLGEKPTYSTFCPKFCCHGNKDRWGWNMVGRVRRPNPNPP